MNPEQLVENPLFFRPGRVYVWCHSALHMYMLVLWSNGRVGSGPGVEKLGAVLDGQQVPSRITALHTRWRELA